jgi:hypothetical protein
MICCPGWEADTDGCVYRDGIAVANMSGANAPPIAEGTLTAGDSRTSRRR